MGLLYQSYQLRSALSEIVSLVHLLARVIYLYHGRKCLPELPLVLDPLQRGLSSHITRRSKSVYSGFVPQYQIVLYENTYWRQ